MKLEQKITRRRDFVSGLAGAVLGLGLSGGVFGGEDNRVERSVLKNRTGYVIRGDVVIDGLEIGFRTSDNYQREHPVDLYFNFSDIPSEPDRPYILIDGDDRGNSFLQTYAPKGKTAPDIRFGPENKIVNIKEGELLKVQAGFEEKGDCKINVFQNGKEIRVFSYGPSLILLNEHKGLNNRGGGFAYDPDKKDIRFRTPDYEEYNGMTSGLVRISFLEFDESPIQLYNGKLWTSDHIVQGKRFWTEKWPVVEQESEDSGFDEAGSFTPEELEAIREYRRKVIREKARLGRIYGNPTVDPAGYNWSDERILRHYGLR